LQQDDESSLGRELSEDEYDALNDETFTHAVRDDWEGNEPFYDPAIWMQSKCSLEL
jgi:hypothetical protein